jgi:hypothetical protein
MGQAFSLRIVFRPQPRAAAAEAALPWARMGEAVGLGEMAAGVAGRAVERMAGAVDLVLSFPKHEWPRIGTNGPHQRIAVQSPQASCPFVFIRGFGSGMVEKRSDLV